MFDSPAFWIVVVLVVLAIVVAVVVARRDTVLEATGIARRRRRPHRDDFRPEGLDEDAPPLKRAGIIVNPTKFTDLDAVRARVTTTCLAQGWGEPIWLETTIADPGTGQARQAVEEGAAVVCPLGGDGTVRAVATALVGTETPLGPLPGGTGNLLARNLDLPFDSIEKALVVALTGQNVRIDVGRLSVDPSGQHAVPDEHLFLVMAGVGLDAAIMAGAQERLKARVGSAAYVVSGFQNFLGPQFRVRMKVDGEGEFARRTRTVSWATAAGSSAGWCSCPARGSTTGCSTPSSCPRAASSAGPPSPGTSSPASAADTRSSTGTPARRSTSRSTGRRRCSSTATRSGPPGR